MVMAQCFWLLLQGGRLGGPHVMHLAARCRRRRLSMVAHPLHPSPLRARKNHGGQDRGDEAASHGRGEREEQSSDGVQDTGRGRRGTALAAASQRCDDAIAPMLGVRMLLSRPSEQLAPQKPHRKDTGTPWARRPRSARCRHHRCLPPPAQRQRKARRG